LAASRDVRTGDEGQPEAPAKKNEKQTKKNKPQRVNAAHWARRQSHARSAAAGPVDLTRLVNDD